MCRPRCGAFGFVVGWLAWLDSCLVAGYGAVALPNSFGSAGLHAHNSGAGLLVIGRTAHSQRRAGPPRRRRPFPFFLSRTGWTATASDAETSRVNGAAVNVLDGNTVHDMAHRLWSAAPAAPLPHTLTVDLAAT